MVTAIDGLPVDGGPEMLFRLLTLGVGSETEVTYLRDVKPQMSAGGAWRLRPRTRRATRYGSRRAAC